MVIWYGNFLKPRVGSLHDAIFTATLVRRRLSYARAPLTAPPRPVAASRPPEDFRSIDDSRARGAIGSSRTCA